MADSQLPHAVEVKYSGEDIRRSTTTDEASQLSNITMKFLKNEIEWIHKNDIHGTINEYDIIMTLKFEKESDAEAFVEKFKGRIVKP